MVAYHNDHHRTSRRCRHSPSRLWLFLPIATVDYNFLPLVKKWPTMGAALCRLSWKNFLGVILAQCIPPQNEHRRICRIRPTIRRQSCALHNSLHIRLRHWLRPPPLLIKTPHLNNLQKQFSKPKMKFQINTITTKKYAGDAFQISINLRQFNTHKNSLNSF